MTIMTGNVDHNRELDARRVINQDGSHEDGDREHANGSEEVKVEGRRTISVDPLAGNSNKIDSVPRSPSRTLHKKKSSYDLRDDYQACADAAANVQDTPLSIDIGTPEKPRATSSPRDQ